MLKQLPVIVLSLIFCFSVAKAQGPADSVIIHSPVKTLSDKRYNDYLKGKNPDGMALVAELNHYPLPDKVIKFKKELDLSPNQIINITAIAQELQRKKVEMGGNIIHNERVIDSLFRKRKIDDGIIIFYTNRYGIYQGELRNAILQACYKTEKLLTPGQIKKIEALQKSN